MTAVFIFRTDPTPSGGPMKPGQAAADDTAVMEGSDNHVANHQLRRAMDLQLQAARTVHRYGT